MRWRIVAVLPVLVLGGCGQPKSLSGKSLTDDEVAALETCNRHLQSGVGVPLDPVRSEEASFTHEGESVSVAWQFESGGRQMAHVCTTTARGTMFKGEGSEPL